MKHKKFGKLLSEGILSVANRQLKPIAAVENDLANLFGYSRANIQRWRRGSLPTTLEQIHMLVAYCVKHGRVGRSWAKRIFTHAQYPYYEIVLDELFAKPASPLLSKRAYQNLPPRFGKFLGRKADTARVLEGLRSRWPVISIEGLGGVGKTTLALELAHSVLDNSERSKFRAVVWVSAKDRPHQKQWLTDVLNTICRVLDYINIMQLPLEEQAIEIDQLLRQHRTLIVVDNFETIEDPQLEDWIMRVPEPSKILLTSRYRQMRSTWAIHLGGLTEDEALTFIRHHAKRLELNKLQLANDRQLLPLAKVTEGNPKALQMALSHIKRGVISLAQVVDYLHASSQAANDIFVDLYARIWELLDEDARNLLRVIPFFVDTISKEAFGAAANLSGFKLDSALVQLTDMALLSIDEDVLAKYVRFTFHPLTRSFAVSKLNEDGSFCQMARQRYTDYYLQFAQKHLTQEMPAEPYWNTSHGLEEDIEAVDQELPNLLNLLSSVYERGEWHLLVELMQVLTHYLGKSAFPERLDYAMKAANAARHLGMPTEEALFRIDAHGWGLIEVARLDDAKKDIKEGLSIAEKLDPPTSNSLQALAYAFLSRIEVASTNFDEAKRLLNSAFSIRCEPIIQYRIYLAAGYLAYETGNYDKAVQNYQKALVCGEKSGFKRKAIRPLYRLGLAYVRQNNFTQAEDKFKEILKETKGLNTFGTTFAKYGLAQVALHTGQNKRAQKLANETMDILSRSGYRIHLRILEEIKIFLDQIEE